MVDLGVIFTWGLAIFGCLGAFYRPVLGAGAFFALSILKPPALWFWSVTQHRYAYWVAICTLIGWVIDGFGERRHMSKTKLAIVCIAGFAGWQWITASFSEILTLWNAPYVRYHCQKITNDMLMVLVAVTVIRSFRDLHAFTFMMWLAAGYLAYEMNYAYVIQHWNRLWIREFAGIDNNGMAMIFAMTVPMGVCLGAWEKDWRWKILAWIPVPLNIHAVEFSMSRTGMLGLLASIPPLALLMPRKGRSILLLGVVIVGGLAMAGPSVRHRFSSIFLDERERDASANSRLVTWAAGWKAMSEHPWTGVGPRCFNLVAREYGLTKHKSIHNLFLQVGADTGFPGLIMLVGIYGGTILALLRNRKIRTRYSPWYPYWVAMVVASLVATTACSQFIGMERVEMPYYICAVGLAAVKVAVTEQEAAVLGTPIPGAEGNVDRAKALPAA